MLYRRMFFLMYCFMISVVGVSQIAPAKLKTDTGLNDSVRKGKIDIFTLSLSHLMTLKVKSPGKKSEKIGDIPSSIIVITRQEIESQNYQALEELLANIPGFYSLGNAFFYGGSNFGVRGFSSPGDFNNVMILVNGIN